MAQNSADVNASPFVLAVLDAQIPVFPHIVNAVILISVLSVGNASTFAASRTIEALAEIGQAPKIFAFIDKKGRPRTLLLVLLLGPIAIIGSVDGGKLFDWLFALYRYSIILSLIIPGVLYALLISVSDQLSKHKHTAEN